MNLNGLKSIFPLDSYIGMAGLPFKITPHAMLEIAYWAQNQSSYQRAEETISKVMLVGVNDDTVRLVTNFVGGIVFDNDRKRAEEAIHMLDCGRISYPKNTAGTLYILADGAALNTRIRDEEGSTWRENKLGEVFSTHDIHTWTDHNGQKQHQIIKKEYVSYIGSAAEFKKHLFACALRGGYGKLAETVILSDGAAWIRNMVEEMFPDAQHILDYFHLCENVNTFAKCIFGMDESKYKAWAKDICDCLKTGQIKKVLTEIEPFKDKKPENCPVNLYGYITNNIKNIDYLVYEQKGYFIGSGAIESGNKTILQDRLKRAGMRWNTKTAQPMLTLKSKAESNLWQTDVVNPFLEHCIKHSRMV